MPFGTEKRTFTVFSFLFQSAKPPKGAYGGNHEKFQQMAAAAARNRPRTGPHRDLFRDVDFHLPRAGKFSDRSCMDGQGGYRIPHRRHWRRADSPRNVRARETTTGLRPSSPFILRGASSRAALLAPTPTDRPCVESLHPRPCHLPTLQPHGGDDGPKTRLFQERRSPYQMEKPRLHLSDS